MADRLRVAVRSLRLNLGATEGHSVIDRVCKKKKSFNTYLTHFDSRYYSGAFLGSSELVKVI